MSLFRRRPLLEHHGVGLEMVPRLGRLRPDMQWNRAFCGACGTPLYSEGPNVPYRVVRIGSLDDPSGMRPALHIWAEAAQTWHHFEPDAVVFEKGPPSEQRQSR